MQSINIVKGGYIRELLSRNSREDSRGFYDYRSIKIKQGTIEHAEGSAQVDLGFTKVLAGVKLDVDTPMPDKPDEGNLIVSAELLPLASTEFEVGPPSPEAIELARVVDRGIRASAMLDLGSLFIEEGKVWSIFVDIYILNYDGNLFDASMLAAVSALSSTRMPKYEEEKVIREGNLQKLKVGDIVTSCTFAKVGDAILLDADSNEESVMDARLTIANDEKSIRAMQKGLSGAFTYNEVLSAIDKSFEKSKELRSIVKNAGD
ncbi:MAG: exosome complex protein Rrp42 [Candidatus Micrarchaeaceae archaeon]